MGILPSTTTTLASLAALRLREDTPTRVFVYVESIVEGAEVFTLGRLITWEDNGYSVRVELQESGRVCIVRRTDVWEVLAA